ncbi:hypothetical protein GQX73_g10330 [Xylaria multiplex]|uniref:Uncharacterized protein n=1 Tax=Xylaria multiplex TaxID=323545 RepID=A0A7C8IH06_9PEZI|nr:hypothetical protein GQX73_g10330 [Xylaria multiplex]
MASQFPGPTTLSNDFRYSGISGPKTPEPIAPGGDEESLPPPRPRLRLKRRHVSQLAAPTQQFLASIAAADVPIPSVENVDQEMMDTLPELHVEDFDNRDDCRLPTPRRFSPPKTPAPDFAPSLVPTNYPDWYSDSPWNDSDLESSPDYESSRPSTAFSTQTSSSLFSLYSTITDDASCISPDLEASEFPHKAEEENPLLQSGQDKPRKAPWTRAMSSHLWATYLLYLSDPRVTPIRLGKSCIPPHGVCARVARQAQRSWKGSKPQSTDQARSRSSTPTVESTKTYIRWPHTGGATRAHLRELCKIKATNKPGRYLSRSPTPFNKAANRRWNRRSTPARSPSVFSAQDMAMSLALSTSDTMQPHGPLAQLTSSQMLPILTYGFQSQTAPSHKSHQEELILKTPVKAQAFEEPFMETDNDSQHGSTRLGSPFLAKSYGPSSSSSITAKITLPKQSNTVGPRRLLKSPVRLTRSRSGTQKRRSVKSLEEKPWRRPSLATAFFREGSRNAEGAVPVINADSQNIQTPSKHSTSDKPQTTPSKITSTDTDFPEIQTTETRPFVISAVSFQASPSRPPRLGSPFSAASSSYSFPNRLSSASNFSLAALRKPFATVQQTPQSISDTPTPTRSSLASRLAYLDQRLKELRNRGTDRRRSQSPM